MAKSSRKSFTLKEKFEIIRDIENGKTQNEVCRERNLPKSTVATLWKKRSELRAAFENKNVNARRLRKSQHDDVDKLLKKWFTQQRLKNVTISGSVLRTKAENFGKQLTSKNDFTCSSSWIDRWKKRHSVCSGKISGEAAAVDNNVVGNWLNTVWPELRRQYNSDDIFNADETGLFYKLTPDKTLKFKGEECKGGKLSKDRITVLLCANLSGNEKRKLLIIGKSQNPRCFKHIPRLPVKYKANRRAWMTSDIFTAELREWDQELHRKKRKILLMVDNCKAHPSVPGLTSIKLVFLPPNTTAKLQPLDQGIIHSFKSNYRQKLLLQIVQSIDEEKQFSIDLLQAINLADKSWRKVTQKTISNCFQKSGFRFEDDDTPPGFESEDDVPLTEWIRRETDKEHETKQIENLFLFKELNMDDYINVDNSVLTTEDLDDQDIIASVIDETRAESDQDEVIEDDQELPTLQAVSFQEAVKSLSNIYFFLQSRGAPDAIFHNLNQVETYMDNLYIKNPVIQTKITNFFK
jgi:hypothetical protein